MGTRRAPASPLILHSLYSDARQNLIYRESNFITTQICNNNNNNMPCFHTLQRVWGLCSQPTSEEFQRL